MPLKLGFSMFLFKKKKKSRNGTTLKLFVNVIIINFFFNYWSELHRLQRLVQIDHAQNI